MAGEESSQHRHERSRDLERLVRLRDDIAHELTIIAVPATLAAVPTILAGGEKLGIAAVATTFAVTASRNMGERVWTQISGRLTSTAEHVIIGQRPDQRDQWNSERDRCLAAGEAMVGVPIEATGTSLDGSSYAMPICQLESFQDDLRSQAEEAYFADKPQVREAWKHAQAVLSPHPTHLHWGFHHGAKPMSREAASETFHGIETQIEAMLSEMIAKRVTAMALRSAQLDALAYALSGQQDPQRFITIPDWFTKAGLGRAVKPLPPQLAAVDEIPAASELPASPAPVSLDPSPQPSLSAWE